MATITKKQFLADVAKEVEALREHATDEEKERLDFYNFNPRTVRGCIYGQMTRDCESERAHELMNLSCVRQMNIKNGSKVGTTDLTDKTFTEIAHFVNGDYDEKTWDKNSHGFLTRTFAYLSALEGYINLKDAKNKNVIAYIKGETDKLVL